MNAPSTTGRAVAPLLAVLLAVLPAAGRAAEGAPSPPIAPASKPTDAQLAGVVAKMQAFYETTKGFDTQFEQRFQTGLVPSRFGSAASKGRMRFRKPDGASGPLMRWDYADGRVLLLVKDMSFTYDPDTKQATQYKVDTGQLSAAVTFLLGKGRILEEFEIAKATRADLGQGTALELTPKRPGGGFSKVYLVVDPATGVVKQSVVVQANGSENRLTFLDPKVNAEVAPGDFDPKQAFPAGTVISPANVPGQK